MFFHPKCCNCLREGQSYDLFKNSRDACKIQGYWSVSVSYWSTFSPYKSNVDSSVYGMCGISGQLCSGCIKITVKDFKEIVENMYNNKIYGYTNGSGGSCNLTFEPSYTNSRYYCAVCRRTVKNGFLWDHYKEGYISAGVPSTPTGDLTFCANCAKVTKIKELPLLQKEWYLVSHRMWKAAFPNQERELMELEIHVP